MRYFQADVFAPRPFTGNGLGVFPEAGSLSVAQMQALTRELRQFECIFLSSAHGEPVPARIFTLDEELPFAGHPVLGAGAVLHQLSSPGSDARCTLLLAGERRVEVRSRRSGDGFTVEMDQGVASFGPPVDDGDLLAALGLGGDDLFPGLPVQLCSTGLPYLIVPLARGLARARIRHPDFEALLAGHGAKFVYLLDIEGHEGRTWDNQGLVEDVATGSAAGPAAAYLVSHRRAVAGAWQSLSQGRFAGRTSELRCRVARTGEVTVQGSVFIVAEGVWSLLPGGSP
jgi:trans-2,3-dihydro-3-hydroxyanthranilate isomerase